MHDMPLPAPTMVARLPVRDEATARIILDVLGETLDIGDVATTAFEDTDGRWVAALYFRNPPNEAALRALVELVSDAETANNVTFDSIATTDWVRRSLEGLKPVEAGRFIIHGSHDRAAVPAHRIGIEIEAALAFGTGHHGTTRGCLLAFETLLKRRRIKPGRRRASRVLDVGSGTGVLAFAAAKALRQRVVASDNDRPSVRVAKENAALNRVGALVDVFEATGLDAARFRSGGRFDIIFANILLPPLKRIARPMAPLTRRNGRVILSGLLPAHANAAISAYRNAGFVLERKWLVDGWVTLTLKRSRH